MSALLPTAILRRVLVMVGPPRPPATWSEHELRLVAEALEEAGYITVARSDVHALRAAADRLLRFTPGVWCNVTGCPLHGVKPHGHQGGSPTPTP